MTHENRMTSVVKSLDGLLRPLGYRREGTTWNRNADPFVEVIDVQHRVSDDSVTVNVGIVDVPVRTIFSADPLPNFFEQPACTVGARIGELMEGLDKWWKLNDSTVLSDIVQATERYVLSFFAKMSTREALRRRLLSTEVTRKKYPAPIINLAILESLLGNSAEACRLLTDLRWSATSSGWRDRAVDVAAQLGCRNVGNG